MESIAAQVVDKRDENTLLMLSTFSVSTTVQTLLQMFSKLAAVSIFASVGVALANPVARATCKPNFEGNAQTVYYPAGHNWVNEWTPDISNGGHVTLFGRYFQDAYATGEFLVPITGQPSGTYQFKAAGDSARQFALEGSASGDLVFKPISWRFPNNQEFSIDCASCSQPGSGSSRIFQTSCTIKHVATGKCATGAADGATVNLQTCNGSNNQIYNFVSGASP